MQESAGPPGRAPVRHGAVLPQRRARTTGRFVVVFGDGEDDPTGLLRSVAGLRAVASSRDFAASGVDLSAVLDADATLFADLGIAVVTGEDAQVAALQRPSARHPAVLSVVPELVHHVRADAQYLEGYRHGVEDLARRLGGGAGSGAGAADVDRPFADTGEHTWGLQATRVPSSPATGRGVSVAVLDTGWDAQHPDFRDREVTAASFVPGESAQDGHGHGTHCVGTACGPLVPAAGPRYGVAPDATVFVAKVLGDDGSGSDGGILAALDWALVNGCAVVSMSLGADVPEVHPPYAVVGRRALDRGTLVVAAAGNNADRPRDPGFVGTPANSPAVLAVGAVDPSLAVAEFSARTLPAVRGGQVDVAGPGVDVHSSWPLPERYRAISGTSMATPHVAGLAALWAERTGFRGRELWATLAQESQRLSAASVDVGGGLVLAPQ